MSSCFRGGMAELNPGLQVTHHNGSKTRPSLFYFSKSRVTVTHGGLRGEWGSQRNSFWVISFSWGWPEGPRKWCCSPFGGCSAIGTGNTCPSLMCVCLFGGLARRLQLFRCCGYQGVFYTIVVFYLLMGYLLCQSSG